MDSTSRQARLADLIAARDELLLHLGVVLRGLESARTALFIGVTANAVSQIPVLEATVVRLRAEEQRLRDTLTQINDRLDPSTEMRVNH